MIPKIVNCDGSYTDEMADKYRIHGENRRGQPTTPTRVAKGWEAIRPTKAALRSQAGVKRMRFLVYNETKKRFVSG